MNELVLFDEDDNLSEFLKKIGSFALSTRNSGMIVRLSIWMLADKVRSIMLVPNPATPFLSPKYSPLAVNPNIELGS